MTWDTPLGDRTADGVEKRLLELAIDEMAKEILAGFDDSIRVGVDVFDAMSGYYSSPPLPEPDGPSMADIIRRIIVWY